MLLVALVVAQAATVALLVMLLQQGAAQEQRRSAVLAGAAEQAARAGREEADLLHDACARSFDRASHLALAAHDLSAAQAHRLGGLRCRALKLAAATALPKRGAVDEVRRLARALAGAPDAPSRSLAAALDAVAFQIEGRLPEARARLQRAQDTQGLKSPWLLWQRGAVLLRVGAAPEAAAALEPLVKELPGFAPGWHRLGLAYASQARQDKGIQALSKAAELDPSSRAAFDLARIHLGRKKWAEAIPHLLATLRSHPDDAVAQRLLASAQFHLKRYPEAVAGYRKAYKLDPQPRTLLSAAIALHASGSNSQALKILDRLRAQAEQVPEVLFERGLVLADLKRVDEAKVELQRYIRAARGRRSEARRVRQAIASLKRLGGGAPPAGR